MTTISMHPNRWRSALVALAVTVGLGACSKSDADSAAHDEKPGTHAHPPATPAAPAKPHGSHDPAHGGLVMMDSHDHHFEVVLDAKGGKHRFYLSDAAREPLPASTLDAVTLVVAGEELRMTRAADDRSWEAAGKPTPATGANVSISYAKGGKEIARFDDLPIEYVLTGKMPGTGAPDHAASGDHAHAAPHGGVVKSTTGGHIELVADASGKFQVWLLDAQLAPRRVDGATVKIKVAARGYADVVATASGDHFEGNGAAIPGEHPAAIVTATVAGKTETARFELHLEPGGEAARGHAPAAQ